MADFMARFSRNTNRVTTENIRKFCIFGSSFLTNPDTKNVILNIIWKSFKAKYYEYYYDIIFQNYFQVIFIYWLNISINYYMQKNSKYFTYFTMSQLLTSQFAKQWRISWLFSCVNRQISSCSFYCWKVKRNYFT